MILILFVSWYSVLFSKPFEYALIDTVVSIPQMLAVLAGDVFCVSFTIDIDFHSVICCC